MEKYELTVVLDGKVTPAKKKSVRESVEKTVTLFKGKVGTVEDWGEKTLAYKIKKSTSGNYLFFPLELDPQEAKSLSTKLNLEESVIRFLLIRVFKKTSRQQLRSFGRGDELSAQAGLNAHVSSSLKRGDRGVGSAEDVIRKDPSSH